MIKVRAHHGMCLFFFIGKGYSSDFTQNMWNYKTMLLEKNPEVTIVAELDDICSKCPNNVEDTAFGRRCTSQEKVLRYDRGVLDTLGIESGTTMHFKDFYFRVEQEIIQKGHRPEICSDCGWNELCILR